jgi:anti-sigma B factor antagonist
MATISKGPVSVSLTYNIRRAGATTVVDLSGRIGPREARASGSENGAGLHELVRDLVEHGHKEILLNLRDVTSLDGLGIGELFGSFTTVRNQGGVLKLTNPNERVRNLIRLTKLDTVIELIGSATLRQVVDGRPNKAGEQ